MTFLERELYALTRRFLVPQYHAVAAFLRRRDYLAILPIICFLRHFDGAIFLKYYYCRITAFPDPSSNVASFPTITFS